jgi:prepilin-type N-terminal cleavage/methylation domain-containing protein
VLKRERGFTMVEVVVALVVLSIMGAAVVAVYNSNVSALVRAGKTTVELYSIQADIETALGQDPDTWDGGKMEDSFLLISFPHLHEPLKIHGWVLTEQVESNGYKEVVTVFIPQGSGGARP